MADDAGVDLGGLSTQDVVLAVEVDDLKEKEKKSGPGPGQGRGYVQLGTNIDADKINKENWFWLKEKYGWLDDDASWCKKVLNTLWSFICGVTVVLFITLPVLLILLSILFFRGLYYVLSCCKLCGGNEGVDSYWQYVRLFIGKQRLYLLTVEESKQGIFWKIWNAVISVYQFAEFSLCVAKKNATVDLYDFLNNYKRLFGMTFPFCSSIAVSDYDYSLNEINSTDSKREGAAAGMIQSVDAEKYLYSFVLNSSDVRYKIAKDVMCILYWFDAKVMKELAMPWEKDHFLYSYCTSVSKFEANHWTICAATMFYYTFNGCEVTKAELDSIVNGSLSSFLAMPGLVHFLLGNGALLKKLYLKMAVGRKLLKKYGNHGGCGKLDKILEYARERGLCEELILNTAVATLFFGGLGSSGAKCHATQRFLSYNTTPQDEYRLFQSSPVKYVFELSRQHSPLTVIANRARREHNHTILGKKYKFPINCIISSNMSFVDQCPAMFGKNGKKFDVNRNNFGEMMAFNCLEKNYGTPAAIDHGNFGIRRRCTGNNKNELAKSVRFCPGHDIQYIVVKSYIESLFAAIASDTIRQEKGDWTFKEKIRNMVVPLKVITHRVSEHDSESIILIRPESFRVLFYLGFFVMLGLAEFVSGTWGPDYGFSKADNPILQRFGSNNICIYFDDPPFTYFGPFLWIILLILVLCYEASDFFRIYDAYHNDKTISWRFYKFYKCCVVYECFAFAIFVQCFAVTPNGEHPEWYSYDWVVTQGNTVPQDIYIHTIPYLCLIYAFWTMAVKRFAYYKLAQDSAYHQHLLKHKFPWYYYAIGYLYLFALAVDTILYTSYIWPNLFGVYTWKISGLEWTKAAASSVQSLFALLTCVCPIVIYWVIDKDLRTVTLIVNRSKVKHGFKYSYSVNVTGVNVEESDMPMSDGGAANAQEAKNTRNAIEASGNASGAVNAISGTNQTEVMMVGQINSNSASDADNDGYAMD